MTREEAREILLLFRPGHRDIDDEGMEEALEMARKDSELGAWFQHHCQLQEAIVRSLQEIQPPEGLKEQILSERRAYFSRSTRRTLVAVCALVVIFLAIWVTISPYLQPSAIHNAPVSFQDRMAGDIQRMYPRMDLETNDLREIQSYLAKHRGHENIGLPRALANTTTTGCKILNWHDKPVSMICFNSGKTSPSTKPDIFLFVINQSALDHPPANSSPTIGRAQGLVSATWIADDKVYYLMTGEGDENFLKRYL